MNDQPTSGNRWERPADEPVPASDAADETTQTPVMPSRASTSDPAANSAGRRDWQTSLTRPRLQLAGAALVVLLVGGGAGFAVGAATGDGHDGRDGFTGNVPGGRHFGDGDGFGGPPGGIPGQQQGQQQPFGQQDDGDGT